MAERREREESVEKCLIFEYILGVELEGLLKGWL